MKQAPKGISLIELLVGSSLAGVAMILMGYGLVAIQKSENLAGEKGDVTSQMVFATRLIQKIGRVASQCATPAAGELRCFIDFSRPATDQHQWVRFLVTAQAGVNALEYQWDTNNDGVFTNTRTHTRWEQIAAFQVCGDAAMNPATLPGSCDIGPIALSTLYFQYANGTAAPPMAGSGRSDRYFRYRITSVPVKVGTGADSALLPVIQQGAFYRRNPSALGVAYQW